VPSQCSSISPYLLKMWFHLIGLSSGGRHGIKVSITKVSRANKEIAVVAAFRPKVTCAFACLAFNS